MAESEAVAIRRLKWPVTLARRTQDAEEGGTGILEGYVELLNLRADVQPVGELTFWNLGAYEQIDTPFTHRIFLRWTDYLDQTQVIFRTTNRPDGSQRTELFRVRRVKELGGRKRFTYVACEIEKAIP